MAYIALDKWGIQTIIFISPPKNIYCGYSFEVCGEILNILIFWVENFPYLDLLLRHIHFTKM